MPKQVDVYYDGWGEHWRWGTLMSSEAITGRPLIVFEYSDEARTRGLELSAYTLALKGPKLRKDFPAHQLERFRADLTAPTVRPEPVEGLFAARRS